MKNPSKTLMEMVNHILCSHPELLKNVEQLVSRHKQLATNDISFLVGINSPILKKSKAQLRQDLFVLSQLEYKRGGFFVEFGATDGVYLSNSHLLEKEFGWKGILAEPAKCWHKALRENRQCPIETDCVWTTTGAELTFNEVDDAKLSTINEFSSVDGHTHARETGKTYSVKTISLNDLLAKYKAPRRMDYLSIDTEGSEYEILSHLDFQKYSFEVITCEHNHTPMREKLFELLSSKGYTRVHTELSQFDDWYVKSASPLS